MNEVCRAVLAPARDKPQNEAVADAGHRACVDDPEFLGVDPGGKGVGDGERGGFFQEFTRFRGS